MLNIYGGAGTFKIESHGRYSDPLYLFVDDGAFSIVRVDGEVISLTDTGLEALFPDVSKALEAGTLEPVSLALSPINKA